MLNDKRHSTGWMRYGKGHKANTRRRVVRIAAERFRKEGLRGVGVAKLMGHAGLTQGGFYNHFASKEALIREAVETGMEESLADMTAAAGGGGIEAFIRSYLCPAHRQHPERGCVAASIGPEIGRHSRTVREAFTRKLRRTVDQIDSLLEDSSPGKAGAIFALLVGTLQLSRAVSDPRMSDQLLRAGQEAALSLAKKGAPAR